MVSSRAAEPISLLQRKLSLWSVTEFLIDATDISNWQMPIELSVYAKTFQLTCEHQMLLFNQKTYTLRLILFPGSRFDFETT